MDRPRIVRVTITRSDGKRRSRVVKTTYYEKSPNDSVFGLTAKLDDLVLSGIVRGFSILVPKTITAAQRSRLERWPSVLPGMLE